MGLCQNDCFDAGPQGVSELAKCKMLKMKPTGIYYWFYSEKQHSSLQF